MHFAYEKEMAPIVAKWLSAQGLCVRYEFKTQWGICDIAACQLDPAKVATRIEQRQTKSLGTVGRVFLFQHLPDAAETNHGKTVAQLAKQFGFAMESSCLESDLRRLVAARHVLEPKPGRFLKVNGWAPLHKMLIAVELKLSRVADAIAQAKANRNFAPHSYIAMPRSVAERVSNGRLRTIVEAAQLGVLGVTETSCELMMTPPTSARAFSATYEMHAVEQFWKASGPGNST